MTHETLIQFNNHPRRGRFAPKAGWFVSVLNTPAGTAWRKRFKQLNPDLIITTYGRNRTNQGGLTYYSDRGKIFKRYVLYIRKKST